MSALLLVFLLSAASHGQSHFVEVARELGIDFVHDNGASAEKNLPETNGAGSAFLDYDGDGDWDLYLVNSGDMERGRGTAFNQLFRNDGRAFARVDSAAGAPGTSYGMGVTAADYDGDGDPDLYLTAWGPDQFYRREGGRLCRCDGRGRSRPHGMDHQCRCVRL